MVGCEINTVLQKIQSGLCHNNLSYKITLLSMNIFIVLMLNIVLNMCNRLRLSLPFINFAHTDF